MNIIKMTCPSCDSNLNFKDNKMTFCPYCGAQLYLDDGVKRSEHVIRKIDESRIYEAKAKKKYKIEKIKSKEREDIRTNRLFIAMFIFMALFIIIPFGFLFIDEWRDDYIKKSYQEQGYLNPGYASSMEGKNYEVIEKQLKSLGFTNIELIDLDDAGVFFNKEGTVESVSIGGRTSYNTEDWFSPDEKVIISYH